MNTSDAQVFAVVSILAGVVVTIFWMVVGWRAMRAHERMADALTAEAASRGSSRGARGTSRREGAREEKSFREFLQADPLARHLDSQEQMRRFHAWKAGGPGGAAAE